MYNEADCIKKLEELKEQAQQKVRESKVLFDISQEKEKEAEKIFAKAEVEREKNEIIQKFIKNVEDKIYSRPRPDVFTVMSIKRISKHIIKPYLNKKWNIEVNFLDPKSNEDPVQYVFTKIMMGVGEYTEKKYTNIYEE
jgi:hypothetical protein